MKKLITLALFLITTLLSAQTYVPDSGGTFTGGVDFNSFIRINNGFTSFQTATNPMIYRSAVTTANYPFNQNGNLVIQARSSYLRDIVFVGGTTPQTNMIIEGEGNVNIPSGTLTISGTAGSENSPAIKLGYQQLISFRDPTGSTANGAYIWQPSSGKLGFGLANSTRVTLTSTEFKSEVNTIINGTLTTNGTAGSENNPAIKLGDQQLISFRDNTGGTANGAYIWQPSQGTLGFGVSNGTRVTLTSTLLTANVDMNLNGNLESKKVKVTATPGSVPDYVFAKHYKLRTLNELEQYIQANKHLPNIPAAKVIEQNGQDVGDLQLKLLEKVEELVLYTIQQQKQLEAQQKEIEALKTQLRKVKED